MNKKNITGCLLGTAIGDSIGLPYEGLNPKRINKLLKKPLQQNLLFGRGMISDDTEHSCLVAKALITAKGDADKFEKHLAWSLRWWFLNLPAGMGMATARACIKLLLGFPTKYSGVFSAGNGAAMRSAIIGVVYAGDLEKLKRFVYRASRITHSDPKAYFGALTIALAAQQAATDKDILARDFLKLVLNAEQFSEEYQQLLEQTILSVERGENLHNFAQSLGCKKGITGYVYYTVPCVLHCWLRHQQDYAGAIEEMIRAGGDADTTAAILGAVIGARVGVENMPTIWLDKLCDFPRSKHYMLRLADALSTGKKAPRLFWLTLLPRNLFFLGVVLLHGFRRLLPPY